MELCCWSILADVYKHSSSYLLTAVAVVFGSVLFVWIYEKPPVKKFLSKIRKEREATAFEEPQVDGEEEEWVEGMRLDARSLADQISAEMTPEQREHEREVERDQLAAIFKLLREQEDKFNVSSMEQLQEQLNLYR